MSDNTIDGLKQRLVGAFVILSLAIIFLPMIFDKPHTVGSSSIVPVPPAPDVKSVVIRKPEKPVYKKIEIDPSDNKVKTVDKIKTNPEQQSVEHSAPDNKIVAVSESASASASAEAKSSKSDELVKPSISSKTQKDDVLSRPKVSDLSIFKNVWMVQLGTFGNHQNAYKLRDRLRSDGFDGHTKDIVIDGKKVIRVFTGPFVNKRVAEKTKKKVDDKYKVKSLLIYFDS